MNEKESNLESAHLESALIYALLFSAFGLFVLAIMSGRYERRQSDIENEFRGIQEMQRRAGGAAESSDAAATDSKAAVEEDHAIDISAPVGQSRPHLMVQLRPLSIIMGTVMLGTWAVLMWRRSKSRGRGQ